MVFRAHFQKARKGRRGFWTCLWNYFLRIPLQPTFELLLGYRRPQKDQIHILFCCQISNTFIERILERSYFVSASAFPWCTSINCNYIRNCLKEKFRRQIAITITWIIQGSGESEKSSKTAPPPRGPPPEALYEMELCFCWGGEGISALVAHQAVTKSSTLRKELCMQQRADPLARVLTVVDILKIRRRILASHSPHARLGWPHLKPITINPVIRMSRLGRFFCPSDSRMPPGEMITKIPSKSLEYILNSSNIFLCNLCNALHAHHFFFFLRKISYVRVCCSGILNT